MKGRFHYTPFIRKKKGVFFMNNLTELETIFSEIMNKYDKDYTKCGVMANLEEWSCNKAKLVNLLSKHPHWNPEALAVVVDTAEMRRVDEDTANKALDQILYNNEALAIGHSSAFRHTLDLYCTRIICSQKVTEQEVNFAATYGIKIAAGQKPTRAINKLFTEFGYSDLPEYNKHFAALSDAITLNSRLI
jgi:hypothetical protein